MRKILVLVVWCLLLLMGAMVPCQATAADLRIVVNGQELNTEVPAVIEEGRTLVPLSAISQALLAYVDWDESSRMVTILKDCDKLELTIGVKTAYKNSAPIGLEVPPQIVAGRTMVPLSFISQALGASVEWDPVTRTVFVYYTNNDLPST